MSKIVYKYYRVNEFLFDVLISNQLFFSSVHQFNDPYDCHFKLDKEISLEDFKAFIGDIGIESEMVDKFVDAYNKHGQDFVNEILKYPQNLLKYMGICCFSGNNSNLLMWSHYADSHKGVLLGFDYDSLTKQFGVFDNVDYDEQPFEFDIKSPKESIGKAIIRKSIDWEYEDEIRFLMERSKNQSFEQKSLVEVYFGERCSDRNKLNIVTLMRKLGYDCAFHQGKINNTEYKVDFDTLDEKKLGERIVESNRPIPYTIDIDLKRYID